MTVLYQMFVMGSCFLSACQMPFLSQDKPYSDEKQGQGKERTTHEKWVQKETKTPRQSYNSSQDRQLSQFDHVQQHWKKPKKQK